MSINEKPEGVIEQAASEAMRAAETYLALHDVPLEIVYVAIKTGLEGVNAVSATSGEKLPAEPSERAQDLLAFLLVEAQGVAEALGLKITLMPMTKPLGRG